MNFIEIYPEALAYILSNIHVGFNNFEDVSIALIDRFGKEIIPVCRPIYYELLDKCDLKAKTNDRDSIAEIPDTQVMSWYENILALNEEKRLKMDIEELHASVYAYRNSKDFLKMREFVGKFPQLAAFNAWLIYKQRPGAELVLTEKQWKELHRRRPKPDAQNLVALNFTPVGFYYEITETQAIDPLSKDAKSDKDILEEYAKGLKNLDAYNVPPHILDTLIENLPVYGIHLDYAIHRANTYGGYISSSIFSDGKLEIHVSGKAEKFFAPSQFTISVNKDFSPADQLHTLFHELAHLFCRHLWYNSEERRGYLTTKEEEFEAETVAWLACKRLNIHNPSEEYLAGYAPKGEIPYCDMNIVMNALQKIERMYKEHIPFTQGLWYKKNYRIKTQYDNFKKYDM